MLVGKTYIWFKRYIGNLAPVVDEESLKAAFIPFGDIKSIDIPIDHVTQ